MSVASVEVEVSPAQAAAARAVVVKRKSSILSVAVTAVIVPGLFATIALPAYALVPTTDEPKTAAAAVVALKQSGAQTVTVPEEALAAPVERDAFTATTAAELRRAKFAATFRSYAGPTTRDFLANPPYPNFSLSQVLSVAMQYQGVPYVYGGATPSGFDCSGFTSFVYAQFGIALPHSASAQGRLGTAISRADAQPGDLVVMNDGGHVGFYVSPGVFLDAPRAGGVVGVRPIWTDSYYIVRVGI